MRHVSLILLASLLLVTGCASNAQVLPQGMDQKADEIGPQVVHIYNGVTIFGNTGTPGEKVADTITVTVSGSNTADGSQQGSTAQSGTQAGSSLGPVNQEPKGDLQLEIPLLP